MYIALLLLLLAVGAFLLISGLKRQNRGRVIGGVIIIMATGGFFKLLDLWGEALWFASVNQSSRFWTEILAKIGMAGLGALLAVIGVYVLTFRTQRERKFARLASRIVAMVFGIFWGIANWDTILRFWHRTATGLSDPILGRDAGFYLFTLPFLDAIYVLVFAIAFISVITSFVATFVRSRDDEVVFESPYSRGEYGAKPYSSLYFSAAVFVFVLAYGKFLSRFNLMYSTWGAVQGPGWTDVHIRLPAYAVVIIITILLGIILLIPKLRGSLHQWLKSRTGLDEAHLPIWNLATIGAFMLIVWFILLTAIPGLFQWLRVSPNEITLEAPYIAHNIKFTRHGFDLAEIEEREFPAVEEFNRETVQENQYLFNNVRLWDWRALDAVYKQFQEIRLYYEFVDVDIDRYDIDENYRQVMVSAREMELSNLPEQSQTFVNRRFKYTHGYGLTLTTVADFTPQGLPNLLIKDIPPKAEYPSLEVEQPRIYYGELTNTHVLVNTEEKEFDYPKGDQNVYVRYSGKGGVQLSSWWRIFLFGWKFDGTRLLLSGYPTSESRVMFHRQIQNRVKTLAPFLDFDDDPYIVLANGKLYWIVDAYTSSAFFPYSEPFSSLESIEYKQGEQNRILRTNVAGQLNGANYVRNSVKVVVDAFDGSVDFYIYEEEDPLITVWQRIFPDLFKSREEMPQELVKHVRYPSDMLLVQGLVYAKYHMSDPTVFYNQEDLWIRATEKYYAAVRPVEPYYVMWEPPESDNPEFILMLPFTPKNRQVMIGWIAGMCDPENYGRFLAYKFPKEKRVLGPQQVETKIDQDSYLSGQLTLWDQRGSNVIRGNVLAIPVANTMFYVEPIYLQAQTAAYPELRLVVTMHNDVLSYAETFDEALRGLFQQIPRDIDGMGRPIARETELSPLIRQAGDAFNSYLDYLGKKQFDSASTSLQSLQEALERLNRLHGSEQGKE
ncbi:MAG: hypothetical protein GF315_10695 [candidate division Zixibacteria bacterium]|nr:hypothetical protein [candidate division Zixibacteria bacterium]